ncbi:MULTISPECIES: nucleotidyltransferase family protein [Paenibacillus]|uniref:nucleotidyltransferase family protein n=1 Tax=Paenibacillus TaxID=44249 RepID=UPI002FDF40BC
MISMANSEFLASKICARPEMIQDLKAVADLDLPEGCIAAGYLRNFVWDVLHGYEERTPLQDVDVLYYDPYCLDEEAEKEYDKQLRLKVPERNWSVKNQARMHIRNGNPPYASVEDAMRYWPETATAVSARWNRTGRPEFLAPYDLEDLLQLRVRQSPLFSDRNFFLKRVHDKAWLRIWPRLTLI